MSHSESKPLTDFERAYIECALWSSTDNAIVEGESSHPDSNGGWPLDDNYGIDDLHPSALKAMQEDCERFLAADAGNASLLRQAIYLRPGKPYYPSDAGHDFWLSRNGHGAGFFDRGLGEIGDKLQDAARAVGPCELYVGDDQLIYIYGREG